MKDTPVDPSDASVAGTRRLKDRSLTGWIRTVMWAALIVPVMSFALLSAWGYQRAVEDSRAKVLHASALSLRQAGRIFEASAKVAAIADEVARGSDAEVRTNERAIQQRLSDLCTGLGFVVNMNVWAADGSILVRSDTYPVDRNTSIVDRQYFIDQQRGTGAPGISEVLSGRSSGRELFNLTMRRRAPNGGFNGIVAVSLSPESFRDYYRSLATDEPDLASFALVRDDGLILARWPVVAPLHTTVDVDNPVFLRVRSGASEGLGVVAAREGRESRLLSFRRVDGWPAYVTAGVSDASVTAGWLHFTALLLAIFLPITAGLVWISWIALTKTRAELRSSALVRHEIERRARAEKNVIETQKLQTLARLTGGVAHDFNNLLTIISNNLHIIGKRHPEVVAEKHLASVQRAVQAGVRLTRQLLSFTRKQALRPETVDLQAWLKETEDLVRSSLGSRTRLEYDIAPDTHPIRVDIAELELALINTALNAQHAMPNGGSLRITAKNSENAQGARQLVVICVEDTGEGIAPELLEKVFEAFFTTKGPGKGSGLGLSQVAGLCDQAGGFADIESRVGHGTMVRMHFPAVRDTREASPERPDVAVSGLRGRVLVVEDNADVALVTEHVLRTAGLEVVAAADAGSALARLRLEPRDVDLVWSDISMPGQFDGIQLALIVQGEWPWLPVILTTGYTDKIDVAMKAGIRVLAKPVHPDHMLVEIERALASRHLFQRDALR